MNQNISDKARAAQERARRNDGRFGEQLRGESDTPEMPTAEDVNATRLYLDAKGMVSSDGWRINPDGTTTRDEAPHRLPWEGMSDGSWGGKPYIVAVQPQYWNDHDYAIDAGPLMEVDISSILHGMDNDERVRVFEGEGVYSDTDWMYTEAIRAGLVEGHDGPFYIDTDDELGAWFNDNPVWVEDGVTPHPSGGYVTTEGFTDERGTVWSYLDADGELHRTDGPAFTHTDNGSSTEEWRTNGRLHRLNGPAFTSVRHRTSEDGNPVTETLDEWWAEGNFVSRTRSTTETNNDSDGWHLSVDRKRVGRNANYARLKAAGQIGEGQ